jgi:hypothetical protein
MHMLPIIVLCGFFHDVVSILAYMAPKLGRFVNDLGKIWMEAVKV